MVFLPITANGLLSITHATKLKSSEDLKTLIVTAVSQH